jgi:hypothetical protein
MTPFAYDYIVPGDVFSDESVLCIRCGVQIMRLSYKEMPKINDPKQVVNVAHKMKLGNYRLLPVMLYRRGQQSITCLPCCQDCVKEINPETQTDDIIRQIKRAMQIEARWAGMPEEAIEGVARQMADARIVRTLTPQEITENKILEVK